MRISTEGLGITPGNPMSLIQASENQAESPALSGWFDSLWSNLPPTDSASPTILDALDDVASHRAPSAIYALVLQHLFGSRGDDLAEEQVVKSATGIRPGGTHAMKGEFAGSDDFEVADFFVVLPGQEGDA